MTLYVNLRSAAVGGARVAPYLIEGDGAGPAPRMVALAEAVGAARVVDKTVVFAVHGFNVSYASGLCSLARLEAALGLPADYVFVGVLWPGDFWIPAINYPAEWRDAVAGGKALAAFADRVFKPAREVSFISHSLGGRLALQAVAALGRRAGQVCLTAPATDDDALEHPYDLAVANAERLTYLASKRDKVLRLAYRVGDWAGDLFFGDDDAAARGALGWHGARWPRTGVAKVVGVQIPKAADYDHGDYFPPGKAQMVLAPSQAAVARYAASFLTGGSPREV